MQFTSIRLIVRDVAGTVAFYERVTGLEAQWSNDVFAEIVTSGGTVAIAGEPTVALFAQGSAVPGDNRSAIVEFRVADVDGEYERLVDIVDEFVQPPTTLPWGNRSVLFRDPDGNLVNLYAPVTDDAIRRFDRGPMTS